MADALSHDDIRAELEADGSEGSAVLEPAVETPNSYVPTPDDNPQQVIRQAEEYELPELPGAADDTASEEPPAAETETPAEEPASPPAATPIADGLRAQGFQIPAGTSDADAARMVRDYVAHLQSQPKPEEKPAEEPAAAPPAFDFAKTLAENYRLSRLSGDDKAAAEKRIAGLLELADDLRPLLTHEFQQALQPLAQERESLTAEITQLRTQLDEYRNAQAQSADEQVARAFMAEHAYLGTFEQPHEKFLAELRSLNAELPIAQRLEKARKLCELQPTQAKPSSPPAAKAASFVDESKAKLLQFGHQPRRGKPQAGSPDGDIDLDNLLHDDLFRSA